MAVMPSTLPATAPTTLASAGLDPQRDVHWNLVPAELYEHALRRGEGVIGEHGAFCAVTTPHTGRSPNDKFVVQEPGSAEHVWWGKVNQPLPADKFERLLGDVQSYLNAQDLFVRDLFAGADASYRV